MIKKNTLFSILLISSLAFAQDVGQKQGVNLSVIHEYGSKKIFANGSLAMGSEQDIMTTPMGHGIKSIPAYDPKAPKKYIGVKKVKDIKFYDTRPEHYSYFIPSSTSTSPYLTTSFYFTGEGRLDEGGIHSPVFKNKFNINNFIGYCNGGDMDKCVSMLKKFDIKSVAYFNVRNFNFDNSSTDKTTFNSIKNNFLNYKTDVYNKKVIAAKLEEMENFLNLSWTLEPSYYDDYLNDRIEPYILHANMPTADAKANTTKYNNLNSNIKGVFPYFFNLNTPVHGLYPYIKLSADKTKKILVVPQISHTRYRHCGTRRCRWRYQSDIVSKEFDLSDPALDITPLLYLQNGIKFRQATSPMGAMYSGYVRSGIDGDIRAGSSGNRSTHELVVGNYMLMTKSETNSIDRLNNFEKYKAVVEPKLKKLLSKNLINSIRINEINYGIAPRVNFAGGKLTSYTTFMKVTDNYVVDNLFDTNSVNIRYISKLNEFINLNEEDLKIKPEEENLGMHSTDSEGVYIAQEKKKGIIIDKKLNPYKGKYADDAGANTFSSLFKLEFFANMNNYILGTNTRNSSVNRWGVYRLSPTNPATEDHLSDIQIPFLSSIQIEEVPEDNPDGTPPSNSMGIRGLERWLGGLGIYNSIISCLVDDSCFTTMINKTNAYDQINDGLKYQYMLDEYPAKLLVERSIQVPHNKDEGGIFQFLTPLYKDIKTYQGAYIDDDGKEIKYCAIEYKPKNPTNNKMGFMERKSEYPRYKQHRNDNFFRLPDSVNYSKLYPTSDNTPSLNSSFSHVIGFSNNSKIDIDNEVYEIGNNGTEFSYDSYTDIGNEFTTTIAIADQCPKYLPSDVDANNLFFQAGTRPNYLNPKIMLSKGAFDYIDKTIADRNSDICEKLGNNCQGYLSELKSSYFGLDYDQSKNLLNSSKIYLGLNKNTGKYGYNEAYEVIASGNDPLNSLGRLYDVGNEEEVRINSHKKEMQLADTFRLISDSVTHHFYSPFSTGSSPSGVRELLLLEAPATLDYKYDYNTTSVQNECAKRMGVGKSNSNGNLTHIGCWGNGEGSIYTPPNPPIPPVVPPTTSPSNNNTEFVPLYMRWSNDRQDSRENFYFGFTNSDAIRNIEYIELRVDNRLEYKLFTDNQISLSNNTTYVPNSDLVQFIDGSYSLTNNSPVTHNILISGISENPYYRFLSKTGDEKSFSILEKFTDKPDVRSFKKVEWVVSFKNKTKKTYLYCDSPAINISVLKGEDYGDEIIHEVLSSRMNKNACSNNSTPQKLDFFPYYVLEDDLENGEKSMYKRIYFSFKGDILSKLKDITEISLYASNANTPFESDKTVKFIVDPNRMDSADLGGDLIIPTIKLNCGISQILGNECLFEVSSAGGTTSNTYLDNAGTYIDFSEQMFINGGEPPHGHNWRLSLDGTYIIPDNYFIHNKVVWTIKFKDNSSRVYKFCNSNPYNVLQLSSINGYVDYQKKIKNNVCDF